jgi:UDP-N-acetylglucosamine diphosphorylase / glucose-1-phosphate thymidylyltransferase / UDP-N-acetylgalactosamine diphosphorylase / glucosamine-1-phosphate N-acetyltransferase / galactosamine-1-phosphate N-acetyltransferase
VNHNCLAVLHFLPRCIGFNREVGKSYYAGHDKIPHQINPRQHYRSKRFGLEDIPGPRMFGAVVGNNCAIGASVIILPARHVPADSIIQVETFLGKCL